MSLVTGEGASPPSAPESSRRGGGSEGKPPHPIKTVLIVEDNAFNLKLLDDLLQAAGYTTFKATDGERALELALEFRPDAILLDIGLPDMSGVDVAKAIRNNEHLRTIPVIAVTAYATPEDEAIIRHAGCDEYVAKPISAPELLRLVRRHANFKLVGHEGERGGS
ncbi:chemotaxis protein CheY [Skermanella stibiiresistens SB22]|uniref:Chemotaxis protein CheY n=1 Tax=Skermanella stibiiresistens SB22 TaxID=1385369 RepID=W9H0M7_9PROT|nr:chemotaxis protein CheY [Skermanella stibiiresistens SB22]